MKFKDVKVGQMFYIVDQPGRHTLLKIESIPDPDDSFDVVKS